jgi:hypothetical protein
MPRVDLLGHDVECSHALELIIERQPLVRLNLVFVITILPGGTGVSGLGGGGLFNSCKFLLDVVGGGLGDPACDMFAAELFGGVILGGVIFSCFGGGGGGPVRPGLVELVFGDLGLVAFCRLELLCCPPLPRVTFT